MTGFIVKPYFDRVEIASDGASYEPDGTLVDICSKVRLSDDVPLAIVGSGPVPYIDIMADTILEAARVTGSVDDTIKLLAEALRKTGTVQRFDSPVRIAIATISETRGPTSYVFSTFEETGGPAPFQLCERKTGFGQGSLPKEDEILALNLDGHSLEKDAPKLFDYMRRQKMINPVKPEQEPFYSIGGLLDLTVVRRDGYEQRLLKTWPDKIGEKIDPFKGEAL